MAAQVGEKHDATTFSKVVGMLKVAGYTINALPTLWKAVATLGGGGGAIALITLFTGGAVQVERGQEAALWKSGAVIRLVNVTTLKRRDHEVNKRLPEAERVISEVFRRVGRPTDVKVLMGMTTQRWEDYLRQLGPEVAEKISGLPFAQVRFIDNGEVKADRYYFEDEYLPIAARQPAYRFRIKKIENSSAPDREAIAVICEKVPQ